MTKEEALKKVTEIRRNKGDDEMAHCLEDDLWAEFISFVSQQEGELGEIARIVISTKKISFSRWHA